MLEIEIIDLEDLQVLEEPTAPDCGEIPGCGYYMK